VWLWKETPLENGFDTHRKTPTIGVLGIAYCAATWGRQSDLLRQQFTETATGKSRAGGNPFQFTSTDKKRFILSPLILVAGRCFSFDKLQL